MQIEDIQDNFRLRSEISVILRTGQQFCGILAGISESSITLRQSSGSNIVLSVEAIDCIFPSHPSETHNNSSNTEPAAVSLSSRASSPSIVTSTPSPAQSSVIPNPETTPIYSIEVITQVVEITTRFKTATQQINLEPLPPDFSMPELIASLPYSQRKTKMQGEWVTAKNQYDHAQKMKEVGRLEKVAQSYGQIIDKYPELSAAAYFNCGCLYLARGNTREALKIFEMGVADSPEPKLFYNLAVVALQRKDLAKSCYALQEFFKRTSASENLKAWYKFLELALALGAVNAIIELLNQSSGNFISSGTRIILESAVFVLHTYGLKEDAHRFMAYLLEDNTDSGQTVALLKELFARLDVKPTESYLKQEEGLLNTAQEFKETKTKQRQKSEIQVLLNRAAQRANQGQYSQAIAEIRKVLQIDPENAIAKKLEAEYREVDKERGLPTGSGPYAQAKRAHILDKDFKKSERLYREAIKQGDNSENAVKDLASVYIQQNQDEKAIQLLEEHLNKVNNRESLLNQLATAYQRLGKYQKEIDCLQKVLSLTGYEKRSTVLNRIALAQYNLSDYEQSEKTLVRLLRENPRDEIAQTRLEGLREAKQTKIYTRLDALFLSQEGVLEEKNSLSDFLAFHLERCDYAGVEATKIASRQFSEKDVDRLRWAADKGIGTKRPRERAGYYLSAAKILMDLGAKAEELNPRVYLRNFCAAMGDACIAEKKPKDVTRSYYAEAFFIAPDWIPQLDVKLSQWIMLHYATPEDVLKADLQLAVESCLEQALKITNLGTTVIESLFYLSWLNREVGRVLINKILSNKRLRESVQALCYQVLGETGEPTNDQADFLKLWERGRDFIRRKNQEVISDITFLNSVSSGLDSLREQITRIQELGYKVRGDLDKQRLRTISEILNSMYDYSQQQSYPEREYYATTIQNRVTELVEEIEANPTKYSWELFRSYLLSLGKTIETHFNEIQVAAEPEDLQAELSIDSYIPDSTLRVECQITVYNKPGKSPAKTITIQVQDSPTGEYITPEQKIIPVTESLQSGQYVTCQIPLVVTREAMESQVFTLYHQLSFTTRRDKQISTEITHSVRLYPTTDFKELDNPYETYAQGSTVESEDMFYGREQDIARLVSAIQNATSAKSLVIYGQKRAAKSSVLYHLKRKLQLPIIPVSFSIGDIIEDFSVATFLYRIIQCLEEAFEDLADNGKPSILLERPSLDALQQNPQLVFQDYMTKLQRTLKRSPEYGSTRIMLLIDEFSYIYGEIMRGRVQDTFMKSWKAMLEKRYFGVVLVGQDTMPQFIQQFPNDFQVAESQRISYLASIDAQRLIVDPIRISETKESRYKGNAVNRLIELTSGSPYYIQIFCNRLVNYMNRKQAVYVTDADIERVKDELISGHNSVEGAVFDNLTSAGDSSSDSIPKEDAEAVLRAIAFGSRNQTYCDRTTINLSTTMTVDQILDDLVRREVIEKQKSSYRIKVDLFKEWLLAYQ